MQRLPCYETLFLNLPSFVCLHFMILLEQLKYLNAFNIGDNCWKIKKLTVILILITMPRKCCTIWDGKACRSNYDKTKQNESEKITFYGFPSNLEEQGRWKKSLANILTCNISKTIGICAKHWPLDCLEIQVRDGFSFQQNHHQFLVKQRTQCLHNPLKNSLFSFTLLHYLLISEK